MTGRFYLCLYKSVACEVGINYLTENHYPYAN